MDKKLILLLRITSVILLVAGLGSCFNNNEYEENEDERIRAFLKDNDIDVDPTESGLYYVELIEGTGQAPVEGDTVEIYYTGYLLSGSIFSSDLSGDPFSFVVGEGTVIQGMDEGITYMNEGGEAMLVIPSWLGYGSTGKYPIPGYTPLVYEISLESVIPGPDK